MNKCLAIVMAMSMSMASFSAYSSENVYIHSAPGISAIGNNVSNPLARQLRASSFRVVTSDIYPRYRIVLTDASGSIGNRYFTGLTAVLAHQPSPSEVEQFVAATSILCEAGDERRCASFISNMVQQRVR